MKYKYTIFFLIFILIVVCIFASYSRLENFSSNTENIDCYVITLGRPEKKLVNIENQQKKIPYKIEKVDAVFGDDLNIEQLVNDGIVAPEYGYSNLKERKRQIGCYMSHLKVLRMIENNNLDSNYSIIFEDDFNISDNFVEQLQQNKYVINNLDFDILFLGNILEGNVGEHVAENIYGKNQVYGTHGYLINNKNIKHILEHMKYIDNHVDLKFTSISELKVYIMSPSIVVQLRDDFPSDITID